MATNKMNEADIRDYLLGKADSGVSGQLDELSFSDQFSEWIGAAERDLIDEYINGSLSGDDRAAFEAHFLRSPRRRDKLDFAKALAVYWPSRVEEAVPARISFFELIRGWRWTLGFAAAAGILALAAVVAVVILRTGTSVDVAESDISVIPGASNMPAATTPDISPRTPESEKSPEESIPKQTDSRPERSVGRSTATPGPAHSPSKTSKPTLAVIALTPALRSASFETIRVPASTRNIEFKLRMETSDGGPLNVEVFDLRGDARVWSSHQLFARGREASRSVSFRAPSNIFREGGYRISLFSPGDDGKPEKLGDYYFRVAP